MDLEFVQCASGNWIPIVNGNLLHSNVDPEREASVFIDKEWDRIAPVKSLIVYGLGGGFHIAELLKRKNFDIVVIEAEKTLALAMREKNSSICSRIEILAGVPPSHITGEIPITSVMSHSYAVLRHPASVRASPYYYTAVSHILNERTIARLRQLSESNKPLMQFLDSLDINNEQILTLPMVEEAMVRRGSSMDREGLIFMALRELVI